MLHNNCCYVGKIAATRLRCGHRTYISRPHRGQSPALLRVCIQKNPPFGLSDALLLQFLLLPLVCQALQDNTIGCICVSHPRATQGMGSAKARSGQQLVLAWLGCVRAWLAPSGICWAVDAGWPWSKHIFLGDQLCPGTVSAPSPEKLLGSSHGGSKARADLPSSVIPHLSV